MKHIALVFALILSLSLSLTACGSAQSPSNSEHSPSSTPQQSVTEVTPIEEDSPNSTNKTLVVYFSRVGVTPFDETVDAVSSASLSMQDGVLTGNVAYLADYIAEATEGDQFQIITEKNYPLTYEETLQAARTEQEDDERPVLISHVDNMDSYDVIFLGYPTWWSTLPQPLVTFLEEYDFSGKTIIPFCSHGGSGLANGPDKIRTLCPDAIVLDGLAVSASSVADAQTEVKEWLSGLNLPTTEADK